MLDYESEVRNFSASSVVEDEGENKVAMTMNANLASDNRLTFADAIADLTLYQAHKEEVDNDKNEWQQKVINEILGE